jgi:cobalamin biosynthesis Mg chelatase CobN
MGQQRVFRIKRLRRKGVNMFSPQEYEDAVSLISYVKTYPAVKSAEVQVTKGDNFIESYIKQVLTKNGLTPKRTELKNKKIKFFYDDKKKMENAASLINLMKGDSIPLASIDWSGTTPVAVSSHGVKVPLSGYTQEMASSGNRGNSTVLDVSSAAVTSGDDEEKGSTSIMNWLLIGAVALVAIVLIVLIIKKKK